MKKHNYPKDRADTGPRPNAGRPARLKKPVSINVTLEQAHIDFLKTQAPSVSEAMRDLVDERIKNENRNI